RLLRLSALPSETALANAQNRRSQRVEGSDKDARHMIPRKEQRGSLADQVRDSSKLSRVATAAVLCWVGAFLLAPIAFSISPSRALQAIVWAAWAIGLGLLVWATLLHQRSHGVWVPRLRSRVLTPQGASYREPAPYEDSISAVADLLTSWVPLSPRWT